MGRRPGASTIARRDAVLAVLRDRSAVTAMEVADAIGMGPVGYPQVYSDLRALARDGAVHWMPAEASGGYQRSLWLAAAASQDPNTASDVEAMWRL